MKMRFNLRIIINILFLIANISLFNSCRKKPGLPVIVTEEVTVITQTSAVSGGEILDDGGAPVLERGVCWNITGDPEVFDNRAVVAGGPGPFTCELSNLMPDTRYYVRAYATNNTGTGYGNEIEFTTLPLLSVIITTGEITSITATGAVSGGNISDTGGGIVTAKGVCWAEMENPTTDDFKTEDGTEKGLYNSYLTGLEPSTTYYVRAYAVISSGTYYGNQLMFTTDIPQINLVIYNPGLEYGTVSDIEGNIYKTIQIGDQLWMAGNLKSTKLNDGTFLINVIPDDLWYTFASGAYCWYNNNISYKDVYGALYNWYAVQTGKICPTGWHVPSQEEWMEMINHTGGIPVAGGRMKEAGTTHWLSPNTGATNESGFTALPGGSYYGGKHFSNMGIAAFFWSSSQIGINSAWVRYLSCNYSDVRRIQYKKEYGFSVRCLKDE